MARYDSTHKEITRKRILTAASVRLKRDGIAASGIAAVMSDSSLTNGAFYAHFDSKDALVAAVVAEALDEQFTQIESGTTGVEEIVRAYLSPEHRDAMAAGCPSAALLDEISRASAETRTAYTRGIRRLADLWSTRLDRDALELRPSILVVIGAMAGILQTARAVDDPQLSDAILERGVDSTLALLASMS